MLRRLEQRLSLFWLLQLGGWLAFGGAMALSRIGVFPLWYMVINKTILATLGLARRLAGLVPEGLLGATFVFSWLLVLATVLTQGLRVRPGGRELGVALGVIACYLLVFVRITVPAERSHLMEYGVLALLVYEALTERKSQGRSVPAPALLAIGVTATAGVLDECVQWLVPSRVFDWRDILFNVLAAVMAVLSSAAPTTENS